MNQKKVARRRLGSVIYNHCKNIDEVAVELGLPVEDLKKARQGKPGTDHVAVRVLQHLKVDEKTWRGFHLVASDQTPPKRRGEHSVSGLRKGPRMRASL